MENTEQLELAARDREWEGKEAAEFTRGVGSHSRVLCLPFACLNRSCWIYSVARAA